MVASISATKITWELLPEDFVLDNEPVDNVNQPSLASALTDSLEVSGKLPETAIVATNYGICATVNGKFVIKAPDWAYVPQISVPREQIQRSYTPHKQGQIPAVVMEFLSDTDGNEYSNKSTYPPGKWFFYEQVLQVPHYIIFEPDSGELEVHLLDKTGHYKLCSCDDNNRYWLAEMQLFIGVWQGTRENRQGYWLRWWDENGNLLLWGSELAQQERLAKEAALQRLEELEKKLRDAGISN